MSALVRSLRPRLGERLCFRWSRMMYERGSRALDRYHEQNHDYEAQDASRGDEARRYVRWFSATTDFRDKVVVDYACGSGAIAKAVGELTHPRTITGVDENPANIARGSTMFPDLDLRVIRDNRTGMETSAVDVVYSTDAFEHFADPAAVLAEMYRIVKPGGFVLIHFIPWFGVEGAHMEGVIPIPWCHVVFSGPTLFKTARRIVRAPFYRPLAWDFDEAGRRRYDLYDHQDTFDPGYLNGMTIRRFRRYCAPFIRDGRLAPVAFELMGFSGTTYPMARWFAWLRHAPLVNELVNRGVYCAMKKLK